MKVCKIVKERIVEDVDYEVCDKKYCCKLMEKWLCVKYDIYSYLTLMYNIKEKKFVIRVQESDDRDNSSIHTEYEQLKYCPFCGEKIDA